MNNEKTTKNYPYQDMSLKDIKGEEWRDIDDFEDYYMISSMGRVKSLARKIYVQQQDRYFPVKEKILKQKIGKDLSLRVRLSNRQDNTRVTPLVSRLVAEMFLFEDIKNKFILPKDKDKFNNNVNNLYLVDQDELSNYNYNLLNSNTKYRGVSEEKGSYIMRFYYQSRCLKEHFKTEIEAARKYDYYIKKFNLKRKGNFI